MEVVDKAYIMIRPDNLPSYLKPVRVLTERTCAISGKIINPGDYAYRCYANPVRLSPTGDCRVLVNEAIKKGDSVLPQGFIMMKIPTFTQVQQIKEVMSATSKAKIMSSNVAVKLLKSTAKSTKEPK